MSVQMKPMLSSTTAIRLVAGREISTRLHSKAFRIMTLIVLVLIIALVVVAKLLAGSGDDSHSRVALVTDSGAGDAAVAQQLVIAGETVGQPVTVSTVADERAGRDEVVNGAIDALVITRAGAIQVVVDSKLDPTLRAALTVLARNLVLDEQISSLGGDPTQVSAAVNEAGIDVQVLAPPRQYDVQQLILGSIAGVLIYLSLLIGGQLVTQGVIEEKSSRVVELLLATLRPWQLMTGKVFGIGLLGLIQVALYGIVGVGLAAALGVLTISLAAAAGTVIWLVVWYLVGFVMYAFAFAGAGALVSRQEDAAGVVMPITTFVIIGYVLGISILPSNPGNVLVEVLSMIPVFAPTLMPMRLAMGGVPGWEAALSLVLALATIPLLAALAGRMYRNAVIHIGARVPLRVALGRG